MSDWFNIPVTRVNTPETARVVRPGDLIQTASGRIRFVIHVGRRHIFLLRLVQGRFWNAKRGLPGNPIVGWDLPCRVRIVRRATDREREIANRLDELHGNRCRIKKSDWEHVCGIGAEAILCSY